MMPRKPDPEKSCAYCGKSLERKRYPSALESYQRFLQRKFCDAACMGREFNQRLIDPNLRFWAKVDPHMRRGLASCWEWMGIRDQDGYGIFTIRYKAFKAHRYAFEQIVGDIPSGLQIDHLCRNRGCVNPYHMELVDTRTNVLRGFGISAQNARKTHCKRGHELAGANLVWSQGTRQCRECGRTRARDYQRRRASQEAA